MLCAEWIICCLAGNKGEDFSQEDESCPVSFMVMCLLDFQIMFCTYGNLEGILVEPNTLDTPSGGP